MLATVQLSRFDFNTLEGKKVCMVPSVTVVVCHFERKELLIYHLPIHYLSLYPFSVNYSYLLACPRGHNPGQPA